MIRRSFKLLFVVISLFSSCKKLHNQDVSKKDESQIVSKEKQKDCLVINKINPRREIENLYEKDSVEYELSYVTRKQGIWLKDTIGEGNNLFFVKFNTELKLIKEGFEPVGNTNFSRRWWLVRVENKEGWISAGNIGRKWYPDDKKLIDVSTVFINKLKQKKAISDLMKTEWDLVYHEDNRCDGSTDGQLENLKKDAIDQTITIIVINDGEGWLCDKKEEKVFNLNFSIIQKTNDWDRFEAQYDIENKISHIFGKGESDYIVIYFEDYNGKYLIKKLEYRSEDPG